jgi:2-polyprenyl-3-methyl-5-hydroxy-6-metoxy-1,4-benzoquinol methylase
LKLDRYISPEYRDAQKLLHASPKGYGGRGDKWRDAVVHLAKCYRCKSILDYGCGQGRLAQALRLKLRDAEIFEYDPAIRGKDTIEKYKMFDLVVCTDVLEHVEPDKLPIVIEHLYQLTTKALFLVIATRPSNKFFPDGRNVHLTIEPASWWKERIDHPGFNYVAPPSSPMKETSREFVALLVRKKND